MKTTFRKSFAKDLRKIKDRHVLEAVRKVIEEVENMRDPLAIGHLKKMAGTTSFYRIRVGNYRIGLALEKDVFEFIRCLSRRDLYRFFP